MRKRFLALAICICAGAALIMGMSGYEGEASVATLTIKDTYITPALAGECSSLDELFEQIRETGSFEGYVFTCESTAQLYNYDDEYVISDIPGGSGEILDAVFAENNYDGRLQEGNYYDPSSGQVFIKKSNLYAYSEEGIVIDNAQVQFLRVYTPQTVTRVEIDSVTKAAGELRQKQQLAEPHTVIELGQASDCDKRYMDVYINGSEVPLDKSAYYIEDGNLIIDAAPAGLSLVEVDFNDSLGDRLQKKIEELFAADDVYGLTDSDKAITMTFGKWQGSAAVGDYVNFTAKGVNTSSGTGRSYLQTVAGSAPNHEAFYDSITGRDGDGAESYVYGTYNGTKKNVYLSTYEADYGINMDTAVITDSNSEYMSDFISGISGKLQMGCIEVSKAAYQDMGKNPTMDFTAIVSAVTDRYVAVSFCSCMKTSKGSTNQVMCGTYAISFDEQKTLITYDVGGGAWPNLNHEEAASIGYNDKYQVQMLTIDDEPVMEGYAFMGWSESAGAMQASYDNGDTLKEAGTFAPDITLHAVWRKAHSEEYFLTEYESAAIYEVGDAYDSLEILIKIPEHHYFVFAGYFVTVNGAEYMVYDAAGTLSSDEIPGILSGGTFINTDSFELYAKFEEPG